MTDQVPVDEYSGMAKLTYALYYLGVGDPKGVELPSDDGGRWVTVTPGGGCVTVVAGTEWDSIKISFLVYEAEPEPLAGEWTHVEEFSCTATDRPAAFTSGTSNECMFAPPLPPDHLFNRPGEEAPYRWRARLLVANFEVEEHVLQFWPA
ncbi:hypothetical protein DN069_07855 [Streptacidiphilus pinicola]|uniref:Uncharacterized protein n=1 Tax=Streptacidiphilus pinicola TaxID=2219663 RepID=A0A2X0ISE8_9ACTN|nr:hypothetical protein [Streptacidiphilus pinicola]RAG86181.1 hypothetical protein DN069_07855 [Streptacidiphilus pinicola]